MASLKDVSLKIAGVRKTKQITKAMYMVSSAKLRGAQQRIERFRPYADKFDQLLESLSANAGGSAHPLLEDRADKKVCAILLVTSDRGLCGGFNTNLLHKARDLKKAKEAEGRKVVFYCMGRKGRDGARKSGAEILQGIADKMGTFDFALAGRLGSDLINDYLAGKVDEVVAVYSRFVSMARQIPEALPLLPVQRAAPGEAAKDAGKGESARMDYIYEPEMESLLAELMPRFIKAQVYRSLLETSCSEHAARMAAMDNATRNCDDLVASLTLLYNKTRQASITNDLIDIVGGAEALKG